MCFGVAMHWLHISAVKALLLTTILYGITAPFLIGILLHVSNNKKIMGEFRNGRLSNITGMIALLLMLATVIVIRIFPGNKIRKRIAWQKGLL